MKLIHKFLISPLLAGLLFVFLGVTATYGLRMQSQTTDSVFHLGDLALKVEKLGSGIGALDTDVYRLLNLIGDFDEKRVTLERQSLAKRFVEFDGALAILADSKNTAAIEFARLIKPELIKLAKLVDDAVDLASVDPNTGVAAMQTADQQFQVIVTEVRKAQEALYQIAIDARANAKINESRGPMLIWAVAVGAMLVTFVISLLMARSVTRPITRAAAVAKAVAAGDLTSEIPTGSSAEIGLLESALSEMQNSLKQIVVNVRNSVESISTASSEIATGNSDLSARTESQASSLEETASSMEHLTQTVRGNADSAKQANQLALSASEVAQRGGEVVGQVVERMDAITESSRKIAEIISVIDGIAFQTNILALNAAVEAARAGEQGRGFAVVAGEVRSLAQRSAEAAREIKDLITESVSEVENGSKLVEQAGSTMSEIVTSVQRVADIIGEISAATDEQSQQIGQVGSAVTALDQVTQQNAALVEQSAAAAESLKDQANAMSEAVSVFKISAKSLDENMQMIRTTPAVAEKSKPVVNPVKQQAAEPSRPQPADSPRQPQGKPQSQQAASSASNPMPESVSAPKLARANVTTQPASYKPTPSSGTSKVNEDDWETF